jgi:starvation-inducible DNA-binding protein
LLNQKYPNYVPKRSVGLDVKKSNALAEQLNLLLANYSIFYQNTRGAHWNIKGEKFFELHLKFEELYTDLQLKIDEVAELILTLGLAPSIDFQIINICHPSQKANM